MLFSIGATEDAASGRWRAARPGGTALYFAKPSGFRFGKTGKAMVVMGPAEPVIAFATRTFEPPGLEIRVNFGVFAGREATPAEIDELAEALRDKVHDLTIVAEDRHEFDDRSEASVHQVRIEVPVEGMSATDDELSELRGRLLEAAERWAQDCIQERRVETESDFKSL
jgi:hypothetical protein